MTTEQADAIARTFTAADSRRIVGTVRARPDVAAAAILARTAPERTGDMPWQGCRAQAEAALRELLRRAYREALAEEGWVK